MEFINNILFGSQDLVTAILLFPLLINSDMNVEIQKYYEDFMKMKGDSYDKSKVDELIAFISNDGFPSEAFIKARNWDYLLPLRSLKIRMVKFYFTSIEELNKTKGDYNDVSDVYFRINEYLLQLMRLRIVVNPDYKLSRNKHPQTGITYLAIKAYWINDEGKKVRKFTKSIGREDSFKDGIEDKDAIEKGLELVQPVLYEYFKEIYQD